MIDAVDSAVLRPYADPPVGADGGGRIHIGCGLIAPQERTDRIEAVDSVVIRPHVDHPVRADGGGRIVNNVTGLITPQERTGGIEAVDSVVIRPHVDYPVGADGGGRPHSACGLIAPEESSRLRTCVSAPACVPCIVMKHRPGGLGELGVRCWDEEEEQDECLTNTAKNPAFHNSLPWSLHYEFHVARVHKVTAMSDC